MACRSIELCGCEVKLRARIAEFSEAGAFKGVWLDGDGLVLRASREEEGIELLVVEEGLFANYCEVWVAGCVNLSEVIATLEGGMGDTDEVLEYHLIHWHAPEFLLEW